MAEKVHLKPNHMMSGSVQHFWHLVFGYLLPAVDHLLSRRGVGGTWLIESCGPVMNPVLEECLTAMGISFSILEAAEIAVRHPDCKVVALEHWDRYTQDPAHGEALRSRIGRVVPAMREAIPNRCSCGLSAKLRNRILFLERSEMPSFYEEGGGAERPLYGRARRYIENLGETCAEMSARGYPVAVYEPGVHSFGCQIEVFSHARGIVGIKGAEFANLVWVRPGTPVYMLTPLQPERKLSRYQRTLCECLGLPFREDFCADDARRLALAPLETSFGGLLPLHRRLINWRPRKWKAASL